MVSSYSSSTWFTANNKMCWWTSSEARIYPFHACEVFMDIKLKKRPLSKVTDKNIFSQPSVVITISVSCVLHPITTSKYNKEKSIVQSRDGYMEYLFITDAAISYTWLFPTKTKKSDVPLIFECLEKNRKYKQ